VALDAAVAAVEADREAVLPLEVEAIIPEELALDAEAPKIEEVPAPAAEETAEIVTSEEPAEEIAAPAEPVAEVVETASPVEIAVEMPEAATDAAELELSIAAGPAAEVPPQPEPGETEILPAASDMPEEDPVVGHNAKDAVPA
jgi:hypothetical protein